MIESVVRGLGPLTGRKIVVLVSDGFLIGLGALESSAFDVRKIADAATRSGVVLYSLDTRGLVSEPPGGQASFQGPAVLSAPGMRTDLQARSIEAMRQGMNALAVDTGGFLVRNSNDLVQGLGRILRDNETYYLLAYEPLNTARDGSFRKIQVRLRGRPELKVRTRSGYFAPDDRKAQTGSGAATGPDARREQEIARALGSLFPLQDVPLQVAADFIALPPQGSQAILKIHVDLGNVPFERKDGRYQADLEIAGAVYDDNGKLVGDVAGEHAALNLTAESYVRTVAEGLRLEKSVPLPPGQYQVRLAAREASRSLLGSASQWIEIPDIDARPLTLSSVFLLADMPAPQKPEATQAERPARGAGLRDGGRSDRQDVQRRPGAALRRLRLHEARRGERAGDGPGAGVAGEAARGRDAGAQARGHACGPQVERADRARRLPARRLRAARGRDRPGHRRQGGAARDLPRRGLGPRAGAGSTTKRFAPSTGTPAFSSEPSRSVSRPLASVRR